MGTTDWKTGSDPRAPIAGTNARSDRRLHRIRAVRRQQAVSLRCAARRLNLTVEQVMDLEQDTADMPLTILYQWQDLLEVPVADLLVDDDGCLSQPILKRARMVRLMKTAAAIRETADSEPVMRLAQMLVDQLVEIMPELRDVSAWHAIGQRRTMEDVGRIAEQPFPESLFGDTLLH